MFATDFEGYGSPYWFSGGYQLSTGSTAEIHVQHINEIFVPFVRFFDTKKMVFVLKNPGSLALPCPSQTIEHELPLSPALYWGLLLPQSSSSFLL
jgi:hypothetical protein